MGDDEAEAATLSWLPCEKAACMCVCVCVCVIKVEHWACSVNTSCDVYRGFT